MISDPQRSGYTLEVWREKDGQRVDRWRRLYEQCKAGPRNVRWEDLVRLMEGAGFEKRSTKSGHGMLFWHSVYEVRASAGHPHHGPVLEGYVHDCLRAIDDVEVLEETADA